MKRKLSLKEKAERWARRYDGNLRGGDVQYVATQSFIAGHRACKREMSKEVPAKKGKWQGADGH